MTVELKPCISDKGPPFPPQYEQNCWLSGVFFPCQEWLGNCKVNYADIFYIQFFNTSFKRQYCKESDPVGADCRLALYL